MQDVLNVLTSEIIEIIAKTFINITSSVFRLFKHRLH